jgi:hypothetical protein
MLQNKNNFLISRYIDFWFLGGASIFFCLILYFFQGFKDSWAVSHHFTNIVLVSGSLSLIANYPHFIISYKLAYSKGINFILKHFFQLILIPILMFVGIYFSYINWEQNFESFNFIFSGDEVLKFLLHVMWISVGWHYAKQTFGCMMVYANLDDYSFSPKQRILLRWSLLSVWWWNFFFSNDISGSSSFSGLTFEYLNTPRALVSGLHEATKWLSVIMFIATCYFVFYKNFKKGQRPSLNLLTPFIAFYLWWAPSLRQHDFVFYLVPFFHSAQYLLFVTTLERRKLNASNKSFEIHGTALILIIILISFFIFEYIPSSLDAVFKTQENFKFWFFFVATQIFINIHHYFIDNVIWRFGQNDIKRYLLKS